MKTINLNEKRAEIISAAYSWFDQIMALPDEVRNDNKKRTGIQIFVREPGTRNFIIASIYHPSEGAQIFAIEKAVRSYSLGHYSSQNSEDTDKMQYRGSVTVDIDGVIIQASVSGAQSDEDVLIAIKILSCIFKVSPSIICLNIIDNKGKIPDWVSDEHYLHKLVYLW